MIGAVNRARALVLPLAIALTTSACSGGSPPDDGPGRDGGPANGAGVDSGQEIEPVVIDIGGHEVPLTSRLVRFDDCDALLDQLRNWAAERVGPWGLGGRPYDDIDAVEEMMVEEDAGGPVLDSPQSSEPATDFRRQLPVEGVDYSGTNVQESGVDEADIIKTDGRRIFAMSAGQLVVVDAAPPGSPRIRAPPHR